MAGVGPEAGELIKRLLVPEDRRATAAEIEIHPWILKTDFTTEDGNEQMQADDDSS